MTVSAQENPSPAMAQETNVNDFAITVGTKNGSGSQTSNLTIMRALFKMGIPVAGKNVFPSNIQGLPTWYTIRLSSEGFLARRATQEIVIAMNPDSFAKDLAAVEPGGIFMYGDHIRLAIDRSDILVYAFPANKFARESGASVELRDYVANMAYVGVLAYVIGIDMDAIYAALDFHFKGKQKPIDLNYGVIKAAFAWATENLAPQNAFRVAPMNGTEGYIMADGNTAGALGSIFGGVHLLAWYPITPATSVGEKIAEYLPQLRKDPETGKNTFAVIQAEDELAAIGMTVGGGWSGLRAMTSTSGPGISLMTEFAGLAYYSETPLVVWDVQRMGPSTGLPTRTSQGDLIQVYFLGHGDTKQIILLPGSVNECFEFGWRAFDVSEQIQTPVFVLSDLDLGMNTWMTRPFNYPETPINRGKIYWEEDLKNLTERWGRYLDSDGDGIPYRTVPGNTHPNAAWFARGTGHDEYTRYTEAADDWVRNMNRLAKKFATAPQYLPEAIIDLAHGLSQNGSEPKPVRVGLVGYGSTDPAIE
ncbi:MAG: 2-oxoacid:acceptor oxidoreductase family protein, partial [Anaerolineales bacterium]|nr:2-oxoacid:acceptor oxidoreductase family protein [Anaerolineales bacterium]